MEKLKAVDNDGMGKGAAKRYDKEKFEEHIKRWCSDYLDNRSFSEEEQKEFLEEIEQEVLYYSEEEHAAYQAAYDYTYDKQSVFQDFFECDCTEYTFQYIWCIYAIAWGIKTYDASKPDTATATPTEEVKAA
jgi:hypothetical protein